LQSIRGAAHFLRRDLEKRGQAQPQNLADIRDIEKVVEEMTLAIDRVRDAAKPLKLTLNKCDISGLLRANFTDNRTFSEQFKKRGIQTELLGLEQLQTPDLMADESLLGEAFSYLVSNALDAISDGGRISIQVAEENQHLIIEFSDDGPGIDEKKTPYEKVFEPFFTTKKGGMGLGLFLVRRNIEAHGGTVNYIGKPQGACFRIKLLRGEHKEA
jgi:signal transduction histidine kinase